MISVRRACVVLSLTSVGALGMVDAENFDPIRPPCCGDGLQTNGVDDLHVEWWGVCVRIGLVRQLYGWGVRMR